MKKQLKLIGLAIALGGLIGFASCSKDDPKDPEPTPTPTPTVSVTGVTLDKQTASINVGATVTLTATVAPANATNKAITWTSSNTAVATVNNGTVTGVTAGTATITVTTADGAKTATCAVTVAGTSQSSITVQLEGFSSWTGNYKEAVLFAAQGGDAFNILTTGGASDEAFPFLDFLGYAEVTEEGYYAPLGYDVFTYIQQGLINLGDTAQAPDWIQSVAQNGGTSVRLYVTAIDLTSLKISGRIEGTLFSSHDIFVSGNTTNPAQKTFNCTFTNVQLTQEVAKKTKSTNIKAAKTKKMVNYFIPTSTKNVKISK